MDDALNRRVNRAIAGLSGNEALLEGLETEPAQTLLDWGITCAKNILAETLDMDEAHAEEYGQPRLRALRQMLRQVKLMTTARFSPGPRTGRALPRPGHRPGSHRLRRGLSPAQRRRTDRFPRPGAHVTAGIHHRRTSVVGIISMIWMNGVQNLVCDKYFAD